MAFSAAFFKSKVSGIFKITPVLEGIPWLTMLFSAFAG
jgi:hypothetical protein